MPIPLWLRKMGRLWREGGVEDDETPYTKDESKGAIFLGLVGLAKDRDMGGPAIALGWNLTRGIGPLESPRRGARDRSGVFFYRRLLGKQSGPGRGTR